MVVKRWLKHGLLRSSEHFGRLGKLGKTAALALQESATRACGVCRQPMLRARARLCPQCGQLHCRACRASVLHQGSAAGQQQVCRACEPDVREQLAAEALARRLARVAGHLAGRLEPFSYSPESKLEKTVRLSANLMYGLKQVGGFIPLGQAARAIKAGYYLVRYGPLLLAGSDVLEAFQLLVGLVRKVDTLATSQVLSSHFFGGVYYMMGEHWGQRGRLPELERMEHLAQDGTVPAPSPELLLRLRQLIGLVFAAKEPTPTDAQRLFQLVLPGTELVLAELASTPTEPAFLLACSRSDLAAYVVLPGTRSAADLVADLDAEKEDLASGQGHRGMVRLARRLASEVGPLLQLLHDRGYSVTVVGHSLGAGVGSLLTLLLRPSIGSIRCYGFGTPACCDEELLPEFLHCMVTVVNRDDVVPRLTVQSVKELAEEVLCPAQCAKTAAWMAEDWRAVRDLERLVELRRRGSPGAEAPAESSPLREKARTAVEEANAQLPLEARAAAPHAGPEPRFLVPGRIVHLYRQDGLGRAAMAAATQDAFTRIALCQNLLNDHKLSAYAEALQQASIPEPQGPTWESFEERAACACCGADFTWAIVLHSEPQQMLARHHCHACGRVVCEGCSQRRAAHPSLGFFSPVRTCDGCFFLQYRSPT